MVSITEIGLFDGKQQSSAPKQKEEEIKRPEQVYAFEFHAEETKKAVVGGSDVEYTVVVKNTGKKDDAIIIKKSVLFSAQKGEEAPEWPIEFENIEFNETGEAEINVPAGGEKTFRVHVHVPHGVRYGDKVDIILTGTSKGDSLVTDTISLITSAQQNFFVVKTQIGQERDVAEAIGNRAMRSDVAVFAVLSPAKLRGYVFVEAMNRDRLKDVVRGIRKARGLVERTDTGLTFDDIAPYLTPKPLVSGIKEGDIVELIAGPFKGEKARVKQIDESKEEITVELIEAMVPIPVTIKGDSIRVLEKEKDSNR